MNRRGFVLAAVLFALVVLAALTASGFFASLQAMRAGRNAVQLAQADGSARRLLLDAMSAWDPSVMSALPVGARAPVSGTDATRVAPRFFALRATAQPIGDVSRSLTALVALRGFDLDPVAAVRARAINPALSAFIDGVDHGPAGWSCAQPRDTIVPSLVQSGLADSVFFQFGDRDWNSLRTWISRGIPGVDSLKLEYSPTSFTLDGVRFLGLLVVDGDLVLKSGAEVIGLAVVRGTLVFEGALGGHVSGAVVASEVNVSQGFTPYQPVVRYSSCAVVAASLSHAMPEPVPGVSMSSFP